MQSASRRWELSFLRIIFILSLGFSSSAWANCDQELVGVSKEYVRLVTLAVKQAPDELSASQVFINISVASQPLNPIKVPSTSRMLQVSMALDHVWPSLAKSEWPLIQAAVAKLENRGAAEKVDKEEKAIDTSRIIRYRPLPDEDHVAVSVDPAYFYDGIDAIMAVHDNSLRIYRIDVKTGMRTLLADLQIYRGLTTPKIFRDRSGVIYILTVNVNDVVQLVKVDGAKSKLVAHRTLPGTYRTEHIELSDGRHLIFAQSPHPEVPKYMSMVHTFEFEPYKRRLVPKGKDEIVGSGPFEVYGENERDVHFSVARDDGYLTYFDIAKDTLRFRKEMSFSEVVGHFHYVTPPNGIAYGLLKTAYEIKSVKLDSNGRPIIKPVKKESTKQYWDIEDFVTASFAGYDWVIDWKGNNLVVSQITARQAVKVISREPVEYAKAFFKLTKPFLTRDGRLFFFFYGAPQTTLYELLPNGNLVTQLSMSSGLASAPFLIEGPDGQIFIYTHAQGRLETMTLFHDLTR